MPPRSKTLPPVWPNAGVRAAYDKRLRAMITEMARSYAHWIKACYRKNESEIALDASSAAQDIERALKKLGPYWRRRFYSAAPQLARWFATAVDKRSDHRLRQILSDAGISVKFQMTSDMRNAFDASVAENVGLIQSIPEQYHTQVQTMVMQSVKAGRDLSSLSDQLQEHFGVTKRRAALISLDQNNKATSVMMAARQTALGIEEGVWLHSHAGKDPRVTHVDNDGKRFNIRDGWFDPDPKVRRRIWPGELIRCRCTWKPVVKGFS